MLVVNVLRDEVLIWEAVCLRHTRDRDGALEAMEHKNFRGKQILKTEAAFVSMPDS